MKITRAALNELSGVTSILTVLAAMPYEKDLMLLIPPSAAPTVAYIGALATVLLRLTPRIARIFGVKIDSGISTTKNE